MTKSEQTRLWAWRCRVLKEGCAGPRNIARTCRHFGISRQAFYRWKRRYEADGEAGLWDRSARPHRSPAAQLTLAVSSVHRILLRHNMNRLPANQKHRSHAKRWQRSEKPQPGHRLQIDVKFLERIPGTRTRLYQFTAIDDCTRIRVLKVYDRCNQGTAIRFLDEVLPRLPFRVRVVQTDNGAEFQSHSHWRLEESTLASLRLKSKRGLG